MKRKPATIPEREEWLYKNPKAKELLLRGLRQAKERRFSKCPPNLDADQALADKLDDSD